MVHLDGWMQTTIARQRLRYRAHEAAAELEAERWSEYFETIAHDVAGVLATLEVVPGSHDEHTTRLPQELHAIGYCPSEDVLELAVAIAGHRASVRYFIPGPRRIRLEQSDDRADILVEDASGTATLIRLFNLPRPVTGCEDPG